MSEAKDPAIKLFGKTIPVPEIPAGSAGAPASYSGDGVEESVEQSHASSTNSSRESHTNKDAPERDFDGDDDKVWGFWGWKFLILSLTLYLECEKI